MGGLAFVMAVTLVTWFGIFGYLFLIDRNLRRQERDDNEQDKL